MEDHEGEEGAYAVLVTVTRVLAAKRVVEPVGTFA